MASSAHTPDRDKLSVVTATLAMALLSGYFVHLPAWGTVLRLPGVVIPFRLSVSGLMALLIAALTVAGVDWVLADHPALEGRPALPHWLLPALTAWVLEVFLQHLPGGVIWWAALFLGLGLWFLVFVAEYVAVDGEDPRYPLAAAGLTGLGFLLFFLLIAALRSAGVRLFFSAPAVGGAAALVALRTLNLQQHGRWQPVEALFIFAIAAQLEAAFHYLPIPPTAFALLLAATTYAAVVYLSNLLEGQAPAQAALEPAGVLVLLLLLLPWAW